MGRSDDYQSGEREGVRKAIAWLHHRAQQMADPHAEQVLNAAAFSLGVALKRAPDLRNLTKST